MSATSTSTVDEFLDAILARDFSRASRHLREDVDFRAMTPSRFWEASDPAGVEKVLRAWFENPEREVERVEPIETGSVADTRRVGWRVHGQRAEGPFVYEQQVYVREQDGAIGWMRIMCCGPRPVEGAGPA
jgi:ketosteroid isomerase-like protein